MSVKHPVPPVSIRVMLTWAKETAEECAEREDARGKHLAASEWREMAADLETLIAKVW